MQKALSDEIREGFLTVELRGIEPLTYSMRTSRATNCAIAPWSLAGYQPTRINPKPAGH